MHIDINAWQSKDLPQKINYHNDPRGIVFVKTN